MSKKTRLGIATVLAAGLTAGTAVAAPGTFPGQGSDNANNTSHCHIVNPATAENEAGFTIVNPSDHSGGHANGAPFTATPC